MARTMRCGMIRYLFLSTSSPIIQGTLERAAGERHAQACRSRSC